MFNGPPPERLGDARSRSASTFWAGLSSSYLSGRKRLPRRLSSGAATETAAAPTSAPTAAAMMVLRRIGFLPGKANGEVANERMVFAILALFATRHSPLALRQLHRLVHGVR